ncbi:MAG: hypothetical protein QOG64_2839 [Acidimicrobiaceae bacterium]|nr:hypothetical protein [Acidimicrobiaceae bacterium]
MDHVEPEAEPDAEPEAIETEIGAMAPIDGDEDGAFDDEAEDDESADDETEADEADEGGGPAQDLWTSLVITLGLGLALIQALFVLFTLAQGLALRRSGSGSFNGDIFHRLGIAFSRSLGIGQGLALVLAVALVSLPALIGRPTGIRQERLRVLTLFIVAAVAVVVGAGTAIGVRAELHLDRLQQQPTTPFRRWALATDVVATLGTALVAFLGAVAALPDRRTRGEEPRS